MRPSRPRAATSTLLATATATASSRAVTGTGGLVSVPQADAEAIAEPTVEAAIRAGAIIDSASSIQLVANSRRSEADASASAFGGGFANIAAPRRSRARGRPSARRSPAARPSPPWTTSSSARLADAIGDQGLDDFFDAVDVDTGADTINFNEHGLITGDSVVYRPTGATPIGTPAGNLADGRTFGVVVVDDDLLHLGAAFMATAPDDAGELFDAGQLVGVSTSRDTIRFKVPHRFQPATPSATTRSAAGSSTPA